MPFCTAGSTRSTLPSIDAVARVDLDRLAERDVLRLRFGDAQLGHQLARPRDAREVRAGGDLLAFLDRHLLQDAFDAGAHVQRVGLALAQLARRDELVETRLLGGELRVDVAAELDDALLFEIHAVLRLLEHDEALLVLHGRESRLSRRPVFSASACMRAVS